jgi:hypothetical protein
VNGKHAPFVRPKCGFDSCRRLFTNARSSAERALLCDGRGRWFDSSRAYHFADGAQSEEHRSATPARPVRAGLSALEGPWCNGSTASSNLAGPGSTPGGPALGRSSPAGGTQQHAIEAERQEQPALTDAQVVRLAELGRRIEAHFGRPQDIEWCLVDDDFRIVQSRPITTLFPIPAADDRENHVYVSVGHQQMMTDPMKPLGLSLWQLTTPAPMYEAGGRLFVDVTRALASPASRAGLLEVLGRSDPLIGDALQTILERGDFIPSVPNERPGAAPAGGAPAPIQTDPAIVSELIGRAEASIAALKRDLRTKSGPALLDFILTDIQELKRILFDPRSHQVVMAGMEATWWLNDKLHAWLGEKNAADTLTQSVPHNVTSEMGLALLEVADVIRPHPDVVALLQHVEDEGRPAGRRGGGACHPADPGWAADPRTRDGRVRRDPALGDDPTDELDLAGPAWPWSSACPTSCVSGSGQGCARVVGVPPALLGVGDREVDQLAGGLLGRGSVLGS